MCSLVPNTHNANKIYPQTHNNIETTLRKPQQTQKNNANKIIICLQNYNNSNNNVEEKHNAKLMSTPSQFTRKNKPKNYERGSILATETPSCQLGRATWQLATSSKAKNHKRIRAPPPG